MHKSIWARLLSCVLALSVAFAAVPKPAFANDGDWLWTAPASSYTNRSDFFYAYMVKQGYYINTLSNVAIQDWDSLSVTDQVVLSRCTQFSFAVNNFTALWPFTGDYVVVAGATMDFNAIQLELQQAYDKLHENDGPYAPGGVVGGGGGGGGGIPDDPEQPGGNDAEILHVDGYTLVGIVEWNTDYYSYPSNAGKPDYAAVPDDVWASLVGDTPFYGAGWSAGSFGFVIYATNTPCYYWDVLPGTTGPYPNIFDNNRFGSLSTTQPIGNSLYFNSSIDVIGGYNCIKYNGSDSYLYPWGTFNRGDATVHNSWGCGNFPITLRCGYPSGGSGGGSTGGTVTPIPDPSTIEKPESPASPTNPQTPERDTPSIIVTGTTQQVPEPAPAADLSTLEQLLRLILTNTNTIIEQMNSFSSQLGQMLASEYDMVYDWFKTTNDWLDQLQAQMTRQLAWDNSFFDWLKSIDSDIQYLQSVAQNGFNDVTTWLQNIFNRMVQGNGGGSKPGVVDPTDPSPLTDWLTQLWTSFLADLQMVLPNQVGAVVDFLDQLRTKFPFSIPWDIGLMLRLLSHAPVTPVFQLPWGYGRQAQEPVTVDLHAWDATMEMVRPMFLLLFALGLALLTRQLLAGLEGLV